MAAAGNVTGTWKGVARGRLIQIDLDQTVTQNNLVGWYRYMEGDRLGEKTMFTSVNYNHDPSILKMEDTRTNITITGWVTRPPAGAQFTGVTSANEHVVLVRE